MDHFVYRTDPEPAAVEDLVFVENARGAKIIAKNNMGTLKVAEAWISFPATHIVSRATFSDYRDIGYVVDFDIGIGPDGIFYSQNEDSLFTLDPITGAINERYVKYVKSEYRERAAHMVVDLENICGDPDGNVFPMKWVAGVDLGFWAPKTGPFFDGRIKALARFCEGKKLIGWITNPFGIGDGLVVSDAYSSRKLWGSGEEMGRTFNAVITSPEVLFLLYKKSGSLVVEAYDLNYDSHSRWGPGRKKLLWKTIFPKRKPTGSVAGLKELNGLLLSRQLFMIERANVNKSDREATVHVTSLDPQTGAINWQKPDIVRVFAQYYSDDGLFYLLRKDRPSAVSGVDQKSGEEKLTIDSARFNFSLGVLDAGDMLYYAQAGGSKKNPLLYDTIIAIDKRSGKQSWTLKLNQQDALPFYERGILYFGFHGDFYESLTAGSNRQYHFTKWARKEDVPKNLQRETFAVDSRTGKILWKVRLEGGDESYIQKVMVKDGITYIKSLTGWLYSLKIPAAP